MSLTFVLFACLQVVPVIHGLAVVHNITRFTDGHFENLAIRQNGQILGTTATPFARVYEIDPLKIRPPVVVTSIPGLHGTFGINEVRPDIFYFAAGNYSLAQPTTFHPETLGIYELDMRRFKVSPNGTIIHDAQTRRVANIPDGKLLNGLTSVENNTGLVLVSDTFVGVIWRVDVQTGNVSIAFRDPTLVGPGPGQNFTGVNGIQRLGQDLYYCNTGRATLYKVPICYDGYVTAGTTPTVVTTGLACDDFTLDKAGNLYVASTEDAVFKISAAGEKTLLAGTVASNRSALIGSTSVKFGRGNSDYDSLYITTNGGFNGLTGPVLLNGTQGISRIDGVKG